MRRGVTSATAGAGSGKGIPGTAGQEYIIMELKPERFYKHAE